MLDNMNYIEIESFVSLRGHSTVLRIQYIYVVDWKEMQYFIAVLVTGMPRAFNPRLTEPSAERH